MWERVNALRSPAWSTWARASQTSRGLRSRAMSTPDFDALNRYGWSWQEASSVDENYMDLAYLVARNSTCKDGHMGCVVVSGVDPCDGTAHVTGEGRGSVALCTINTPLFGAHRSDCHAEANAVTQCAARGVALRGQSCYVTRSPCLACYKLLASSGIGRIVSPQKLDSADCAASAAALGIEVRAVTDTDARRSYREQMGSANEDMDRVRALREERKRLRTNGKFGRKTIRSTGGAAETETPAAPAAEAPLVEGESESKGEE